MTTVKVKDIMTPDVLTVGPEDSVEHAASVIINAGVSGLAVVDKEGQLQGVISDFTLLAMTYAPEIRARPVSSVMTATRGRARQGAHVHRAGGARKPR